jgi:Mn2+/Fe2+ NRAMP family transporter
MATHHVRSETAGTAPLPSARPVSARIAGWLALVLFVVALIMAAWGASAI